MARRRGTVGRHDRRRRAADAATDAAVRRRRPRRAPRGPRRRRLRRALPVPEQQPAPRPRRSSTWGIALVCVVSWSATGAATRCSSTAASCGRPSGWRCSGPTASWPAWTSTSTSATPWSAAAAQVGFAVGHASAQMGWRGLLSRPTWRILLYSAEEPPEQRGLVLVDGVDGEVDRVVRRGQPRGLVRPRQHVENLRPRRTTPTRGTHLMAWDFSTDPEFQEKLDWVEQFCREEVEPLEYVFPYAVRSKDPKIRGLVKGLQDQVKDQGLWAIFLDEDLGGPGLRPAQARAAQRDPRSLPVGAADVRRGRARHRQHGDARRVRHRGAEEALARSRCSTRRCGRRTR